MSDSPSQNRLLPILMVNFIGVLGYSVVMPILIFMVRDLGGNALLYGALGAVYPFFQFFGAPRLGKLSDRIGRKRVLLLSQGGTLLAWILFITALLLPKWTLWEGGQSDSYVMTVPLALIFLARMLDGYTGGNVSVANAYLADVTDENDREANFGKMASASSLGMVIGPAFAGLLASTVLGTLLPVIAAAVISLIALFVIQYRMYENRPCEGPIREGKAKSIRQFFQVEQKDCYTNNEASEAKTTWSEVLAIKGMPVMFAVYFLTWLAFSFYYLGMPLYVSDDLGWTTTELGLFLTGTSLIMILFQGPVLRWLSKHRSPQWILISGAVILTIGFGVIATGKLPLIILAGILLAAGNGIMWPTYLSQLSRMGTPQVQGAVQGYASSLGSVASMIGMLGGGLLYAELHTQLFALSSLLFAILLVLLLLPKDRTPKLTQPV
ncbi:MFS transporter [Cryomorphaceae bacterium]|nr:MFS transporter [Cryomorphaceae bacterium]